MKKLLVLLLSIIFTFPCVLAQDLDEYLIAYWSFDDSTAADHSGNNYHGTIVNNPTPVLGVNGKGTAFHFQGRGSFAYVGDNMAIIGDHIRLPRIPFEALGEFTISMWVKEDDLSQSHGEGYLWFGEHESGWLGIFHNGFWMTSTPKASYAVGADLRGEDPFEVVYDYYHRYKWINFTLVYDGASVLAYRDGEYIGQKYQDIKIASGMAAIAAHFWNDGGHKVSARFTGSIDEVKIYNKKLTRREVEEEYESLCNQQNLIAYWNFDDGTADDQTGNGYHGEIKNDVTSVSGFRGKALYLNGNPHLYVGDSGGHIMIPRIDLEYWNEYSISMWVKEYPNTLGGGAYFFMGDLTNNYLGICNFANEKNGYDSLDLQLSFAVGAKFIPPDINTGIISIYDKSDSDKWVNYVLVYNDGIMSAYKDTKLIAEKRQETVISNMHAALGRHWWTDNSGNEKTSTCFTGAIDEVKIYCKALTIEEIEDDFTACGEDMFNISTFDNTNTTLLGDAKFRASHVRLTESAKRLQGAMWYNQYVDIYNGFETEFKFRIPDGNQGTCDPDGSLPGADGFAFVIHNDGREFNARGETDWGIGYIGIANSIAIEFDLFRNDSLVNDPNGNHIAVQTNRHDGNVPYHDYTHCLSIRDDIIQIKPDGTEYYAKIDYNMEPNTLRIYISEDQNFDEPALELPNFKIDDYIDLNMNKAIIGFTASTGDAWEAHDILEWSYCPFIGCTPYVPEIMMYGDIPVCEGDTIILRTTEKYDSYSWSDGSTNEEILATESGTYNVTVFDEEGCPGTGTIYLNFSPKPKPEITVDGRKILCDGDSVKLSTQEGFAEYQWREEILSTVLSNTNELIVTRSGRYYVYVENEAGCWAISEIVEIVFSDMQNGLEILGLSNDGVVEFDSTYFPDVLCKDILIRNIADDDITLDNAHTFKNTEFSVTASQFPIHIPAGETVELQVCYSPQKLGEARDTLAIEDFCNTQYIPLHGICPPDIGLGNSKCDVRTQVTTTELPEKGVFSASPPVPNPSTGIIEVNYIISEDQDITFTVTNTMGIRISTINISQNVEYYNDKIQSVTSRINLSDYPSGIYFINLSNGRDIFAFNVSLYK